MWAAKRKGNKVALNLTKMKDGSDGVRITLAASACLDSLVLRELDSDDDTGLTAGARKLVDFVRNQDAAGATAQEVMDNVQMPKATVYRLLSALCQSNHLVKHDSERVSRYTVGQPSH